MGVVALCSVGVCVGTLAMGEQVSMNTRSEVQQQVGVPTDNCQIPRVGNGVGIVTCSCPLGSSAVVSCTVGRSCLDSRAVNVGLVEDELGAQGLGFSKNVGLVQGWIVFMLPPILSHLLPMPAPSQCPRRRRLCRPP